MSASLDHATITIAGQPGRGSSLGGLAAALVVAGLPSLFAYGAGALGWFAAGVAPALGALAAWWRDKRGHAEGEGRVEAADGTLTFHVGRRRLDVPLDALMWTERHGAELRLFFADGRFATVTASSPDDAHAFHKAVERGVERRELHAPIGELSPWLRRMSAIIVLAPILAYGLVRAFNHLGAAAASQLAAIPFAVLFAYLLGGVRGLVRPSIGVGLDGVVVQRTWRRRFIPHDAIASVALQSLAIRLTLTDGEVVAVDVRGRDRASMQRVVDRIEAAGQHARDAAARHVEHFAREGRDLDAWGEAVAGRLEGEAHFREQPLSAEDAAAVLADPTARLEHRIGAALGLRRIDPARTRKGLEAGIRVAADERVRIALETLRDGDDAAILELAEAEARAEEASSRA